MAASTASRTLTVPSGHRLDSTRNATQSGTNALGNGAVVQHNIWGVGGTHTSNGLNGRGTLRSDVLPPLPSTNTVAESSVGLSQLVQDSIPSSQGRWSISQARDKPQRQNGGYLPLAQQQPAQKQPHVPAAYPDPLSPHTATPFGSISGQYPFPRPPQVYTRHPTAVGAATPPISPLNTRILFHGVQPVSRIASQPPSRHSDNGPDDSARKFSGFEPNKQRADSFGWSMHGNLYAGDQSVESSRSRTGQMSMTPSVRGYDSRKASEQYNSFPRGNTSQTSSRPSTARKLNNDDFDDTMDLYYDPKRELDLSDLDMALNEVSTYSQFEAFDRGKRGTSSAVHRRDVSDMDDVSPGSLGAKYPPRTQYDWTSSSDSQFAKPFAGSLDIASMTDLQYSQMMGLRNPYASTYSNSYAMPPSLQYGSSLPYYPMFSMGLTGLDGALIAHTDLPIAEGVQSKKLYEFKLAGKSNKRYELKDVFDNIAEFAGDQHGSRFIQTKLETASSDEKERVFREIEPNAIPLMTDVFGNYVIQKFFDHGHQDHKRMLANKMRGQVLNLSTQMYGCRVVQKALEHVLIEQQTALVSELENHVLECVKNKDGNHVIQKAIERCPPDTISFIYQAFVGQVQYLSLHAFGCRVIQRCLERQDWFPAKVRIMAELHESMGQGMVANDYGNYVVQHVVEKGTPMDRKHVFSIVIQGLESYSKHKFASNVVEKCIEYSDDGWRREVVSVLVTHDQRKGDGDSVLAALIKDNYGNYVIQKLLEKLCPADFIYFHQHLQPAINHAKRSGCGKQLISIEKKMQDRLPYLHANSRPHHTMMLGIPQHSHTPFGSRYGSAANTPPPLTADTQSLQSSGLPSVNGDTVEGAQAHIIGMMRNGSEGMHGMR
ncbi:hypothetical protein B0A48_14127 [Cryoendolithus antarcticus]|uniref:PUM-HD domain-containing protein n=1 Tax=Cryoendolithus antarcticus TaxID=1507870 RepID=A0A1V8SLA7_9PEZI|nr:hypothetical protein B0A48_14127 [Cryoendolithus antarcticus]